MTSTRLVIITSIIILAIAGFVLLNFVVLTTENKKSSAENRASDLTSVSLQHANTSEIQSPLKNAYVTVFSLPNGTGPNGVLVDRNGLVWTSGSFSHTLLRLDPKGGTLESYPIPEDKHGQAMVWSMVEDNDGFIWFSQFGGNPLWRFDPSTEKFQIFHTSLPPFQMKVDNKTGNIWYTTLTGNTIGVIQKTKSQGLYKITEFPLGENTTPSGLFLEDGYIWVAELGKGKIAKYVAIKNENNLVINVGKILEIPQSDDRFASPTDVLVPNNQTIWVTEHVPSTISEYGLESKVWKRFTPAQYNYSIPTLPFWMRESLDHKGIWFNEHQGNRIAFLNITDHELTEFEIPNNSLPDPSPYMLNNIVSRQNLMDQKAYYEQVFTLNLSLDPLNSNRLWFSQWNNDKLGVVDRSTSVPFDIKSDSIRVVLSGNNTIQENASVNVKIYGNKVLFLKASSSMEPNGEFAKISVNFTKDFIDFSKESSPALTKLELQNNGAKPGNYTLGISATDGAVTKTIFMDLIVTP